MSDQSLVFPAFVLEATLLSLREAGHGNSEAVVLWLGRRQPDVIAVSEAYVPEQQTEHDRFWIPQQAMSTLLAHLGATGTFIAAQVHSHPQEAFHSLADDKWAIVRHLGALSLVVPYFASGTTADNFLKNIAAFQLSAENKWKELSHSDRIRLIRLV